MRDAATVVVLTYYLYDSKANKFLSDALVGDSITVALRGILKSCGKKMFLRAFVAVIGVKISNSRTKSWRVEIGQNIVYGPIR